MISSKRSTIECFNRVRTVFVIGITVIGLLLTGCAGVNYLRDAQSAFSEAARLENQLRTSATTTIEANDLLLESEIRAGYASAIASIAKLDSGQIASLKSDKLWGVVLTIKALSYWRLGEYDEMEKIAEQAQGIEDQIYPRDRALLMALPGLRRVDEAHAIIAADIGGKDRAEETKIKEERLKTVERLVKNANAILNEARQSVSEEHSVRSYLLQSELGGYKNLLDARNKFRTGGRLNSVEVEEVKQLLTKLDCSFKNSLKDDDLLVARTKVVLAWQVRFGLVNKDFSCNE